MIFLVTLLSAVIQVLIFLVIISVILSYFMDPYHPIRRGVDRIVDPLLAPIRGIVPPIAMLDFSPLILILLLELLRSLILRLA